jgi:fatty aldehyde decarbonylase
MTEKNAVGLNEQEAVPASKAALEAAARGEKYNHLISFIVSNAVAGELVATNNYAEMVPLVKDADTKLYLLHEATEEAGHAKTLMGLCKRLGIPVADHIVEPEWHNVRKAFSTAAAKGSLATCIIIQDLMLETMAVVLYRTLAGLDDARTDSETTRVALALHDDETEHLDWGSNKIKEMARESPGEINEALAWAHHNTMPHMFHLVRDGCDTLCSVLGVECGTFHIEEISTDLETVRINALDAYIETLDRAGFDPKITAPLIASMSSYEGMPRAVVAARSAAVGS